jgi:tetratricopeptide (TPR) repeat protein
VENLSGFLRNQPLGSVMVSRLDYGVINERIYTSLISERFQEAEESLQSLLTSFSRGHIRTKLMKLSTYAHYRAGSLIKLKSILTDPSFQSSEADLGFRAQIALETSDFPEVENLYRLNPSNDIILSFRAVALIFTHRFGEVETILNSMHLPSIPKRVITSVLRLMEGNIDGAVSSDPGISKFNEALFSFHFNRAKGTEFKLIIPEHDDYSDEAKFYDLRSAIAGSVSKIPSELAVTNNMIFSSESSDTSSLIQFLEKKFQRLSTLQSLDEWNLRDYVIANLVILYTREDNFFKAKRLLALCEDTWRLERCFLDKSEWKRLQVYVDINADSRSEPAELELKHIIPKILTSRSPTIRQVEKLFAYTCVLGRYLYDKNRFEELGELHEQYLQFTHQVGITCQVNAGHMYFAQGKHAEAIKQYMQAAQSVANKSILELQPAVLANLCVSLLLMDRNDEAENVFSQIHDAEKYESTSNHSTIVNLVIGHLYCSQGNFEFGLDRIIEAIGGDVSKLENETWYYAKTVLMALAAAASSGNLPSLSDNTIEKVFEFLVKTQSIPHAIPSDNSDMTIQDEAKIVESILRRIFYD